MIEQRYADCVACGEKPEVTLEFCPCCDAPMQSSFERRAATAEMLRFWAYAMPGGVLISVAALIPMGVLDRGIMVMGPAWIVTLILASIFYHMAGRCEPELQTEYISAKDLRQD